MKLRTVLVALAMLEMVSCSLVVASDASTFRHRNHDQQLRLSIEDAHSLDNDAPVTFLRQAGPKKVPKSLFYVFALICCICVIIPTCSFALMIFFEPLGGCKPIEEFENELARAMREEFSKFPEEEQLQFCTKGYRKKCDQMFKDANTAGTTKLKLKELRPTVEKFVSDGNDTCSSYLKSIDDNGDSVIDSEEFYEMMKVVGYRNYMFAKSEEDKSAAERTEGS